MTDIEIIDYLVEKFDGQRGLASEFNSQQQRISQWKRMGIPANARPLFWFLLQRHCPELMDELDMAVFFKIPTQGMKNEMA